MVEKKRGPHTTRYFYYTQGKESTSQLGVRTVIEPPSAALAAAHWLGAIGITCPHVLLGGGVGGKLGGNVHP